MKITIFVSGRSGDGDNTVQCGAAFDVQSIDQDALQQMTQAARQCAATVDAVAVTSSSHKRGEATNHAAKPQGGRRLCTDKQVKAIRAISGRLGVDLSPILHDRFGASSPTALSIGEASTLIDELKNNLLPA